MRIEKNLILAALLAVAGCGGSGSKNDGGATVHDMAIPDLAVTTSHPDLSTGGSAGGGGSDGGSSLGEDGGAPVGSGAIHLNTSATLGSYVVDGAGRTLYIFGSDVPAGASTAAISNCTGACLTVWPVFHVDSVTVQGNLNASDFAELTRSDGAKQTTYKGWPLYYFHTDVASGDVGGQGVGGVWFVATQPFYNIYVRNSDATHPHFLTDGAGRSLYYFFNDTRGTTTTPPVSACQTGQCATAWPVYTANPAIAPSTLLPSDFTVLTWDNGTTKQMVYKGHPLYYFAGDAKPGDTTGRGVGNVWDTLDPTLP